MKDAPKSVLLVEDDHDTRVILRMLLEEAGYFVFTATDGWNALGMLGRIKPPALILLDLKMPLMDGEDFLDAIRKNVALANVPVIVVSACVELADKVVAQAFVPKPVDPDALLDTMKRLDSAT